MNNNKYYIYSLNDPDTNEVRYVGKSIDLKTRYVAHLNDKSNSEKSKWIRGLIDKGKKPIVKIIEKREDSDSGFWEHYYIDFYLSEGCDLLNRQLRTSPSNNKDKDREEIRNILDSYRQKTVAEKIGILPNTLSSWLAGRIDISPKKIEEIKRYIGIDQK